MVGSPEMKSIETTLTDAQACLFSRLVMDYVPKETQKDFICIGPGHIAAHLKFTEAPALMAQGRRFYKPGSVERVTWHSSIHDEAVLTRTGDTLFMAFHGSNMEPNGYYSHIVRVRPEVNPGLAVDLRIIHALRKAVKSASSRKRRRELVLLQVRKLQSTEQVMDKFEDAVREELNYLPETVRHVGLLQLKDQLLQQKPSRV